MRRKSQQQSLLAGPPDELSTNEKIAKVNVINGNNVFTVTLPSNADEVDNTASGDSQVLVELPPKFRNSMWVRRGGFVLVNCSTFEGRANKLAGEIVDVIHDEKSWMKMHYWPAQFRKQAAESTTEENDCDNDLPFEGNPNRRRQESDDDDEN